MTVLHRVLWSLSDDRGNPIEKAEYFEEGDERFVRRLVAHLDKDPRCSVHSVTTTSVEWTDGEKEILDVGPLNCWFEPVNEIS